MFRILSLFSLLFLALACQSDLAEADSDALSIYNSFHQDLKSHYAGFANEHQADSLYYSLRKNLKANSSDAELWQALCSYANALNDEHIKLYRDAAEEVFISGDEGFIASQQAFSLELIAADYLENVGLSGDMLLYGELSPKIAYLYVAALLEEDEQYLINALEALDLDAKSALVIDLRQCIGGYDGLAAVFAAHFSRHQDLVFRSRIKSGSGAHQFSAAEDYNSPAPSSPHFSKPIVFLTDRGTVSEAEILSLYLRSYDQVHHIGDSTAGALSMVSPARFLANGWRYEYSIQKILQPDGSSFEKLGIKPEISIENNPSNIQSGKDLVLEGAIQFLTENYNIN